MQPPLASRVSASLGARPGGILAEHTRRAHGDTDPQRHWCHGHPNVTTVRHQPLSHRERGMCCVGRTRERAVDMASHHTPPTCVSLSWPRLALLASRGMRRLLEHGRVGRGGGALPRQGIAGMCDTTALPAARPTSKAGGWTSLHACMLATETSPKPHGQITPFLLLALQLNLRSSTCGANVVRRTRFALGWTYCHACH
jgi:hypothetical protein